MTNTDSELRDILKTTKVIAVVGLSPNEVRPSHFVGRYLSLRGYRVIPVNPGHGGKELFGETIMPDLQSIPSDIPVDMIDIFRRSDAVPAILEEALEHLPSLRSVWMQIGVKNDSAAVRARENGLNVVMDRCPKIEHQRLFGELRKGGFNTGVISSKLF